MRGRRSLLVATLALALATGFTVAFAAPDAAGAAAPNLLRNGSFARSVAGWGAVNAHLRRLRRGPVGRGAAAVVLDRRATSFTVANRRRPVVRTRVGVLYTARGWVRSLRSRQVCLRLTEMRGGSLVGYSERCVTASGRWQLVGGLRYRAVRGGSRLRFTVTELGARRGDRFDVDGLYVGRATSGASSAPAENLVPQGSFEGSLDGWEGVQAGLELATGGAVGDAAGRVTTAAPAGTFAARPVPLPVEATIAGASYTATAWLRSMTPGRIVCLRLREWVTGTPVASSSTCMPTTAAWRQFPVVTHSTRRAGAQLELDVYQKTAAREADDFDLDGVVLAEHLPTPGPGAAPPTPNTPPVCARYASPAGGDAAEGTLEQPWRTAQRLVNGLAAGETGCLLDGLYVGDVIFRRSRVSLAGAPGADATVGGRVEVKNTANDVTVSYLSIDGSYSPQATVQVFGDRVRFIRNDVTNRDTRICFVVGDSTYGVAYDFTAAGNHVHDCGRSASDMRDHGFYLAVSRRARILRNWIYDGDARAGWGIHLYPDADGTFIANNVIDGNGGGIVISSRGSRSSDNNIVRGNVISNSLTRFNVEGHVDVVAPRNNLVERNCVWNGRMGNVEAGTRAFVARNNVVADPRFFDRASKDYRLGAGSRCAGMGP